MILTTPPTGRRGERGLTLIEALIALALLLLMAIGVLPLFTRAMVNNAAGSEATQVANHARFQLENIAQLPFNNVATDVTAGNELLVQDHWYVGDPEVQGDELWAAPGAGTGFAQWDRTTRIRQFSINAADDTDADNIIDVLRGLADADDDGEFDDPLVGGTDTAFIHVKEVGVELASSRDDPTGARESGPLGASPAYRVRWLKPY